MENKKQGVSLGIFIRWNINFISEEAKKIETSEEIRSRVLMICDDISEKVLSRLGEDSSETITKNLYRELLRFDKIIREIDGDDKESDMFILLTGHIGDIFFALKEKGIVCKDTN